MGRLARAARGRRAARLPARHEGIPRACSRGRRRRAGAAAGDRALVDWALELLAATPRTARDGGGADALSVLDLGTGSGAIALALKHRQPSLAVSASDVSAAALAVARRNATRLGLAIDFVEIVVVAGVAGRRFDFAVANPPYIAADDPHLAALRHEPRPGADARRRRARRAPRDRRRRPGAPACRRLAARRARLRPGPALCGRCSPAPAWPASPPAPTSPATSARPAAASARRRPANGRTQGIPFVAKGAGAP